MSAPTPSWYDVLGVEPDADPDVVRAAWKAGIADLDPTERRFHSLNAAAEVLLDPDRRAAHDAELAHEVDARAQAHPEPVISPVEIPPEQPDVEPTSERDLGSATPSHDSGAPSRASWTSTVRSLLGDLRTLVILAVAAIALVVVTTLAVASDDDAPGSDGATGDLPDAGEVAAARAAAEAAIVPVLSYDYRELERDRQAAATYLSPDQRERYDALFEEVIQENAVSTETVVTARVIASGIVRTGPERVDVLLFVNRPTTNSQRTVEYRDQVTAQMREIDGEWLIDCLITQPGRGCGDD